MLKKTAGGVLTAALLVAVADAHARSIKASIIDAPRRLAGLNLGPTYENAVAALLESAGRGIPIPASSGAFTYRYDPKTGTYERSSETFGPTLYMERPQTLGRGVWGVAFSGQYLEEHE